MSHALAEIIQLRTTSETIPQKKIREWLLNKDIEVQGAAAGLITSAPFAERVQPRLENHDYKELLFTYYRRCFEEDPHSEWALSRHETAHEIANWFRAVPRDEDVAKQEFLRWLKAWMTDLYLESSDDVKKAILIGALEHILEETRWRLMFKDWSEIAELKQAYKLAMEWAVDHER